MTATKADMGGLDFLGTTDHTKASSSEPVTEHQYEPGGLDYLGADVLKHLSTEELVGIRQEARTGLDHLGAGKPFEMPSIRKFLEAARLVATWGELIADEEKARKWLRFLIEVIDRVLKDR